MGKINNRDCRVTITVSDEQTGQRYDTKAFPTGQGPGLFSAPVSLDTGGKSDMHWIHVTIQEDRARIVGGDKTPGDTFKLEPVKDETVRLRAGAGTLEYQLKRRFLISVKVEVVTPKFGESGPVQPATSSAKAMTELLAGDEPKVSRPTQKKLKTRSAGQVRSLLRSLGIRGPNNQ